MAKSRKRTEVQPDGNVTETADVFDEAIAAAQDRQAAQAAEPVAQEPGTNGHTSESNGHAVNGNAPETNGHAERQSRPRPRPFGHWRDSEVGVRIEDDTLNRLSTIRFREAPPLAALDLLLDHGWVKDPEVGGYSKKHSVLRPAESRQQNDATFHEVRNIIRVSKGLDPVPGEFVPGYSR